MKVKIKNLEIQEKVGSEIFEFPKYSTQLMNLANSNSQGTRPRVVGQLSDLIQEFEGNSIKEWKEWYYRSHPQSINNAVEKIYPMVENFQSIIDKIDKEMVRKWVEDLVITKTFIGLRFQEAILSKVAEIKEGEYSLAKPEEESQGIDGYVDKIPVSIKPLSYQSKNLNEMIDHPIIYYSKKKDGVTIEIPNELQ